LKNPLKLRSKKAINKAKRRIQLRGDKFVILDSRELERRRNELIEYYRNKCDRFVETLRGRENLEDRKMIWRHWNLSQILPEKLVRIQHTGPLRILAFSDYRIHDTNLIVDFVNSLEEKPDIILYAGDDTRRFSPFPLDLLKISPFDEERPRRVQEATDGLIFSIPKSTYNEGCVQEAFLATLRIVERLSDVLKNLKGIPVKDQEIILKKTVAEEFPSLIVEEEEKDEKRKEIRILDESGAEILSMARYEDIIIMHNFNLLSRSYDVSRAKKIGENKKYIYFYIPLSDQPEENIFEKLASNAKYGLAAVIGNDDSSRSRIYGNKVFELHSTWLLIGSFLIIGLEGSTCGIGPSGNYLEGDVKLRLEVAGEILEPGCKLILVSHTPPRGLLDRAMRFGDEAIGSLALRDFIEEREDVPLVVCGHAHRCGGKYERLNRTTVVNVSSHDDSFSRANVALIHVDEKGEVSVNFRKLPSPVEEVLRKKTEDECLEALQELSLTKNEAKLFMDMSRKKGDIFFEDLPELANLKFRYGFSWDNAFKLYEHGVKAPQDITDEIVMNVLRNSSGIHQFHLKRAYTKVKRELEKGRIYLMEPIPLLSHNKIIVYDTEYYGSSENVVLYGFLDMSTGKLSQFWFDEEDRVFEYLEDKERDYVFIHWGGADKKILKERFSYDAQNINLLYHVQVSLVAPTSSSSLHDVFDALCGHKEDEWWERFFYNMSGFDKLGLCWQILKNPSDDNARKVLSEANKADILALAQIIERIKAIEVHKENNA
jgi:Icc-related predicted phosphoesterase